MEDRGPHVVVLAGGKGTRFWPMSTPERPKQFIPLFGERSLLSAAVARVAPLVGHDHIWISTDASLGELARAELPTVPDGNFVIEPAARNTLPCIALACARVRDVDPDAVVAVLCADHLIRCEDGFRRLLLAASDVAAHREGLVTFGIQPTRPETGYGYVMRGDAVDTVHGFDVYRVAAFTEKPERAVAESYIADGRYFWNSGMFVWRVGVFFDALERHQPEMAQQIADMCSHPECVAHVYPTLDAISVDYGLMEHAESIYVMPVDVGWDDVGSWESVWTVWERDAHGNAVRGPHVGLDTSDCLVFGRDRPIITIGVEDLIVVESEAGVLVCPRGRAQEVKDLVAELPRTTED